MSRYRSENLIKQIIIHCSDSPNGRIITANDIDSWHHDRGFQRSPDALAGSGDWQGMGPHGSSLGSIGYHYVIRVNGITEVGRRLNETGAHARGHNLYSIGVCLIGKDQFTPAQWATLKALVTSTQRDFQKQYKQTLTVLGHNEVNTHKTCPGFDVQAWLAGGMEPLPGHILEPSP